MAITISQTPAGLYPAYNDSYISFTSTLSNQTKAEVTFTGSTLPTFTVYPDLDGNYLFNFKNGIKTIFNLNSFEDAYTIPESTYTDTITNRYINQEMVLEVFNDSTSESVTTNIEFIKSVKQVGEDIHPNESVLLNKSADGITWYLTYFEGYPTFIELQKVIANDVIKIKNLNTGDDVEFTATATNTFRIWIDKIIENWITSNTLPLTDGLNRLELYINDVFKSNIMLKKPMQRCGTYLKWFNSDGGYSTHLFEEFYSEKTKAKSLGTLTRNEFLNVGESPKSFDYNLGNQIEKELKLKANVDENEFNILQDLLASPSVQYYTSNAPYIAGKWLDVKVSGTLENKTKKHNNVVNITVELPQQYTTTY